jgi:uncharacterized protein
VRRCVFIVAKAPVLGLAKTRLAQGIGAEQALALYRCFLADAVATVEQVPDCTVAFSFWPPQAATTFQHLCPHALLFPQHGDDFGTRLLSGFQQACAAGFNRVVLVGSDNPGLPASYIARALDALDAHDAVIGPSEDGGYYLLGMRASQPALFHPNIAWSTEVVAAQTRAAARAAGLTLAEVPIWYDIDTASDLSRLYADLHSGQAGAFAPQTHAQLDAWARNGLFDLLVRNG